MKTLMVVILLNMLMFTSAMARDSIESYSVKDALATDTAKEKLGTDVSFYFGNSKHGEVLKTFGTFSTNKKTNAFNKSDKEACQWVFLSAMIALKDRAVREGGNAVINIKSIYRNNTTSSNNSFQCGAGTIIAGVALEGTVVEIITKD
ncbi:excinuclease ABC subunit A [Desulforhopalus vacuolatus]|uniref:excinuclease ABC subunit A n=1 Tax=Desulforhopalus vacuolatus TaxID=40414 RepID=UPI001965C70A|nr:excinuclease ABC subunit A [Desulforhopalus vacuolatus]